MVATAGGAERAPCDAVAGLGETGQWRLESTRGWQLRAGVEFDVVEMKLGGDRRTHRELAVDIARGEAGGALTNDKAGDALVGFRPDHGDIGDRAVGDPALGPVENPAAAVFL